jgi:biotin carboxylase
MRVTPEGSFRGMEIHNDVISDQLAARLVDTGFYIAEQYRAAGYRGYFDVDFVASKNGQLYVTESNVRRTGGTHVHAVAEQFFGKDFMYLTYILSNNSYDLPKGKYQTFTQLQQALAPVLYTKDKREGVVIISENLLTYSLLAFIIFGSNKKRAYEIETQMEALLRA